MIVNCKSKEKMKVEGWQSSTVEQLCDEKWQFLQQDTRSRRFKDVAYASVEREGWVVNQRKMIKIKSLWWSIVKEAGSQNQAFGLRGGEGGNRWKRRNETARSYSLTQIKYIEQKIQNPKCVQTTYYLESPLQTCLQISRG